MIQHNENTFLVGGSSNHQKCLQLVHGTWKEHSVLNFERSFHSAVTAQNTAFVFGGYGSRGTYEYLPKDSTTWLKGKNFIRSGFCNVFAIAVKSDQEIWLIGGNYPNGNRILSFNVSDHTFQTLPLQLIVGRSKAKCAFIPNTKKVMITGGIGRREFGSGYLNSTEILDPEDETVTMASPMSSERAGHGIGVFTINGKDRLAVFGGYDGINGRYLDSIEFYNPVTEKWELSDIKLNEPKHCVGFLTAKLSDLISKL